MYEYIKGEIVGIYKDHIIVDNNGIGYLVFVSNPYRFSKDQERVIYIYQQVREDGIYLYGFETEEEKDLFLKLILVKGIGCKSAIGILATGEIDAIINAITNKNVSYLKKIPGIGPKAAQQIILDLSGKFNSSNKETVITSPSFDEACEVLIALGYKQNVVDKVMGKLSNESLDTNGFVKKALSMIVK